MADSKISELSSNDTLDGTELVPLVQSGSNVSNVKALLSAIKTYIVDGYLTAATTATTYLSIANSRYQFVSDAGTTYTVLASAVTANGNTIVELSNNSLTSITINAATATGKSVGDSVNISITGTYASQVLVGSGATLEGDLTFSYQYETKTLIYKGSNVWKVVG